MARGGIELVLLQSVAAWLEATFLAIDPISESLSFKHLARGDCHLGDKLVRRCSKGFSESCAHSGFSESGSGWQP
jgi:hypothetical protein